MMGAAVIVSTATRQNPGPGFTTREAAPTSRYDQTGVLENRIAELLGIIRAIGENHAPARPAGYIGR